jgi:hypothetical protein
MPTAPIPEQGPRRRAGIARNLTLDPDADAILSTYCPRGSGKGQFVSRLLFEFEATLQERYRLRQKLKTLGESG